MKPKTLRLMVIMLIFILVSALANVILEMDLWKEYKAGVLLISLLMLWLLGDLYWRTDRFWYIRTLWLLIYLKAILKFIIQDIGYHFCEWHYPSKPWLTLYPIPFFILYLIKRLVELYPQNERS